MAAVMGRVESWAATGCLLLTMCGLTYLLWWTPREGMRAIDARLVRVEALVDPLTLGPTRAELARKIEQVKAAVERRCGCRED